MVDAPSSSDRSESSSSSFSSFCNCSELSESQFPSSLFPILSSLNLVPAAFRSDHESQPPTAARSLHSTSVAPT